MVILYTTPTCGTCKVAGNRLTDALVEHEKVDLTEHPGKLAELKERLGVDRLQLPIIEYRGDLLTIADLRAIIETETS